MSAMLNITSADPKELIADLQRQLAECTVDRDQALAKEAATAAALREAIEYQTATSDVLNIISRSTFDLQPTLETLVQAATRLCTADIGGLFLPDGEFYKLAASFASTPEYDLLLRARPIRIDRRTLTGQTVLEARVVHIPDVAADPEYGTPEAVTVAKVRTALGVPLLRQGEVIGVISLGRRQVEPFSERQIELVRTFTDQAVIAIENTRLINETREALEQQTATAEVLQVINSSPGDLAPVFDAILEKATHLCDTAFGVLWRYDGELFHPAAVNGPAAFAEFFMNEAALRAAPESGLGIYIAGEDVVQVADLASSELYRQGNPGRRAYVELGGGRTAMSVALRKDAILYGAVQVYRREVRPFTNTQIALLQNFAAQAVIAMENARLLTETREALEQQTATAEVLEVINSSPGDLAPVFDTILRKPRASVGLLLALYNSIRTVRSAPPQCTASQILLADLVRQPINRHPDHLCCASSTANNAYNSPSRRTRQPRALSDS